MSRNSVSARVRQTTALSLALAVALAAWLVGCQQGDGDASRESDARGAGSKPSPQPEQRDPVKPCSDDKPLGGWIWTSFDYKSHGCTGDAQVHVRFRLFPSAGDKAVALTYNAPELWYEVSLSKCVDVVKPPGNPEEVCSASSKHVSGTVSLGPDSGGGVLFVTEGPSLSYTIPAALDHVGNLDVHCTYPTSSGPKTSDWPNWSVSPFPDIFEISGTNRLPIEETNRCDENPAHCFEYCVSPTVCNTENTNLSADCISHPERYAVIPFSGSIDDKLPKQATWHCLTMAGAKIKWEVCCGCGEGPKGAPEPGATPPCGEPTNQRALLDVTLDQQKALMRQLDERYARYRQIADEARQYQSDFELAARDCKLWQAARFLLGFLVSNYAPTGTIVYPEPGNVVKLEPGKEFYNFLGLLEKVENNDGSWVLPNYEFKDWVSLEDAWDGFQTAYSALGPSSPEKLLQGLQECGAPTNERSYKDALKYLRLLQQIEPLMQQVNRTLNDLRQKDIELFNKWANYQQACREYESCSGGDPASCESLPPARAPNSQP